MARTSRSNLSVGLPFDLVTIRRDDRRARIDDHPEVNGDNRYFQMIRRVGGEALREAFSELPNPVGRGAVKSVATSAVCGSTQ